MVDVIWFSFEPEHQNLLRLINLSVSFHLADFHCHAEEKKLCTDLPSTYFTPDLHFMWDICHINTFVKKINQRERIAHGSKSYSWKYFDILTISFSIYSLLEKFQPALCFLAIGFLLSKAAGKWSGRILDILSPVLWLQRPRFVSWVLHVISLRRQKTLWLNQIYKHGILCPSSHLKDY